MRDYVLKLSLNDSFQAAISNLGTWDSLLALPPYIPTSPRHSFCATLGIWFIHVLFPAAVSHSISNDMHVWGGFFDGQGHLRQSKNRRPKTVLLIPVSVSVVEPHTHRRPKVKWSSSLPSRLEFWDTHIFYSSDWLAAGLLSSSWPFSWLLFPFSHIVLLLSLAGGLVRKSINFHGT